MIINLDSVQQAIIDKTINSASRQIVRACAVAKVSTVGFVLDDDLEGCNLSGVAVHRVGDIVDEYASRFGEHYSDEYHAACQRIILGLKVLFNK